MPTSILNIELEFNIRVKKTIKWGTAFHEDDSGIYIVTTNSKNDFLPKEKETISFIHDQVNLWKKNAPNITLNNKDVTTNELTKHLSKFWLPDETILYIGKAEKQTFSERICQFYNHKVGKKSPHKGGYWLKLLSSLNEYHIHLLPTNDSHKIETQLLQYFIDHVSNDSKLILIDKELCLPFANLQLKSGIIKKHGLRYHYQ